MPTRSTGQIETYASILIGPLCVRDLQRVQQEPPSADGGTFAALYPPCPSRQTGWPKCRPAPGKSSDGHRLTQPFGQYGEGRKRSGLVVFRLHVKANADAVARAEGVAASIEHIAKVRVQPCRHDHQVRIKCFAPGPGDLRAFTLTGNCHYPGPNVAHAFQDKLPQAVHEVMVENAGP
jgi:hypothetical protein